jgi:hypothetical protein
VFWNGTAVVTRIWSGQDFPVKIATSCAGLVLARDECVIWFYERKGEHLRCEIRQQIEGDRFALVVTMPDGSERTEMFDDSGALNRRSVELEEMLRTKGWNGPYARDI